MEDFTGLNKERAEQLGKSCSDKTMGNSSEGNIIIFGVQFADRICYLKTVLGLVGSCIAISKY